jgi:hypothetical protein
LATARPYIFQLDVWQKLDPAGLVRRSSTIGPKERERERKREREREREREKERDWPCRILRDDMMVGKPDRLFD